MRRLIPLIVMVAATTVFAAEKTDVSPAKAKYERERAVCLSGQSHQDRETCLREAGAVYDEARRGGLTSGDLKANARQRCEGLPDAERKDCLLRAEGVGSTEGSVKGGGVIKETVTRTVSPAPAASAAN